MASLFWSRLHGRAVDPLNTHDGTVWIIEDISDHRRDEDQLRRAMLEMQAVMDNAPLAIGFQRDKGVLRYNRRFAECFGFDGDSGVGLAVADLYPSRAAYENVVRQASPLLRRGQPFQGEMEMRRRDGSTFWALAYGYVLNPESQTDRGLRDTIWLFDDRSAQKAAEEATRQLMLEQQAILDNASVGILFSRSRLVLRCNPRFAEMFGYAQEEMTGLPAAALFPSPAAYAEFGAQATPLLGQGLPYEQDEALFRRRDGSLFWCRIRAKAVDQAHSEQGTIWILEDVTASRQAQMEVAAIMTNASVSILYTKNRLITRYNLGFAAMFGYSGDEALGLPGRALYVSQQSYDLLGAAAFPFLSVAKPFQTEVEMMRRDGSTLWAQLIAYVVNPDDPAAGTIWIIEDRTEAKRAEESLRNALLENQAILDSAVLGISVVEGGYNLRANSKMEELFGYGPGEINGLSVQALYPDVAAWKTARGETARDFAAGRVHMSEYQLVRKDGSRFWARLSGRPFDLAHAHGRSVWLVDDVTARREAAEAVRRARDELELRVHERTAELAGANSAAAGRDRRAAPGRGARASHGLPRQPDGLAEPRAAVGPPGAGHAGLAALRAQAGRDVHRPGPLQDHQRFAGPHDGRFAAQGSGCPAVPRGARQRYGGASGRRRIRRAGAGHPRHRRGGARGREDHRGADARFSARRPCAACDAVDWHLPVSGRWRRCRRPDAPCRCGHVPRQGQWPQ